MKELNFKINNIEKKFLKIYNRSNNFSRNKITLFIACICTCPINKTD